jgi:hypothetical protein
MRCVRSGTRLFQEKGEQIMDETKVVLSDHEIPRQWYNIQADLPTP